MSASASLLLIASFTAVGADPDAERVVDRIREHFSRIQSVHVRCTERGVESGGLSDPNPAAAPVVYKATGIIRDYDLWIDPPKQRVVRIEKDPAPQGRPKGSSSEIYFDGSQYIHLNPDRRSGVITAAGSPTPPTPSGTAL